MAPILAWGSTHQLPLRLHVHGTPSRHLGGSAPENATAKAGVSQNRGSRHEAHGQLRVECHHHGPQQADQEIEQVKHFLGGPAILRAAASNAYELHKHNDG
jgi:hypothetical protein